MSLFIKELWAYVRTRKKYWLLPFLAALALLAILLSLSQQALVTQFVYPLF